MKIRQYNFVILKRNFICCSISAEFGGVNNGDATIEEHNLSGYRPLYPPYFQRNINEQQQTYYDKEYYSRGAQIGNFDARLDRTLKTPAAIIRPSPSDDVQVYVVSLDSQSQPRSAVQLLNRPQNQVQLPTQPQFPIQTAAAAAAAHSTQFYSQSYTQPQQSQQYARGFSNYRNQQTQHFFYSFRFPSS